MNRDELIEALFEEFDTNRDGMISRREFVDLVRYLLGEHGIAVSARIFDKFDTDHDNAISRDELVKLVDEYVL